MERPLSLAPDLIAQSVFVRALVFALVVSILFIGLVFVVSKTLVDPYCRHLPNTSLEQSPGSDSSASSGLSSTFLYPTLENSLRYLRRDSFCDAR